MRKDIKAAELKYYNANSRGKSVGDCVKRSMSLAFDVPYSKIEQLLNAELKKHNSYSQWNQLHVFTPVIKDLGGGKRIYPDNENMTLDEFADSHDPNKIYLLLVGKKPGDHTHAVTVRDGKIWDSWNSKNQYVESYWEIDGTDRAAIRDTGADYLRDLAAEIVEPTISNQVEAYANKHNLSVDSITVRSRANSFRVVADCTVKFVPNELISKNRKYDFEIALVIEPTWTDDEVKSFLTKMSKQRAYDRMWTINENEKKLAEAAEVANELGIDQNSYFEDTKYAGRLEDKFLSSLPGWVKPLVTYVSIYKPGQYHDSYELTIRKLPRDDMHPDREKLKFLGYDADDIKKQLQIYREDYIVPGYDYDKDW